MIYRRLNILEPYLAILRALVGRRWNTGEGCSPRIWQAPEIGNVQRNVDVCQDNKSPDVGEEGVFEISFALKGAFKVKKKQEKGK
jgi:hypothetical protein